MQTRAGSPPLPVARRLLIIRAVAGRNERPSPRGDVRKLPDEELMLRCQRGGDEAFDELFARYEAPTLGLLTCLVSDRGTAEALTQEAFLRIYREADSYQHPRRFSTWFFTIVRNLARNELRWRRRHPARSLEEPHAGDSPEEPAGEQVLGDGLHAPGRSPLSTIVGRETIERLHEAISELPEQEREILVLHRFSSLKCREIADILGARLSTVRSRLHSALCRLRQRLRDLEAGTRSSDRRERGE